MTAEKRRTGLFGWLKKSDKIPVAQELTGEAYKIQRPETAHKPTLPPSVSPARVQKERYRIRPTQIGESGSLLLPDHMGGESVVLGDYLSTVKDLLEPDVVFVERERVPFVKRELVQGVDARRLVETGAVSDVEWLSGKMVARASLFDLLLSGHSSIVKRFLSLERNRSLWGSTRDGRHARRMESYLRLLTCTEGEEFAEKVLEIRKLRRLDACALALTASSPVGAPVAVRWIADLGTLSDLSVSELARLARVKHSILHETGQAVEDLSLARERAMDCEEWQTIARAYAGITHDPEEVQGALQSAEGAAAAAGAWTWIECALGWWQVGGKLTDAERCLARAMEALKTSHTGAWLAMARCQKTIRGDQEEAIASLREYENTLASNAFYSDWIDLAKEWVDLFDNDEQAEACLARAWETKPLVDWSVELAQAQLELLSDEAGTRLALESIEGRSSEVSDVLTVAQGWLSVMGNRHKARNLVGQVDKRVHDVGSASDWNTKYRREDPAFAAELAMAWASCGDSERAKQLLEDAERRSQTLRHWQRCADGWVEVGDQKRVRSCLLRAEELALKFEEFVSLAGHVFVSEDEESAVRLLRKGETLAVEGKEWGELASLWKSLERSQEAERCRLQTKT